MSKAGSGQKSCISWNCPQKMFPHFLLSIPDISRFLIFNRGKKYRTVFADNNFFRRRIGGDFWNFTCCSVLKAFTNFKLYASYSKLTPNVCVYFDRTKIGPVRWLNWRTADVRAFMYILTRSTMYIQLLKW